MALSFSRFRVDLLLLAVAISWGSTYLVAKDLVAPGSVIVLLALRMTLAAVIMGCVLLARRKPVTAAELRVGGILGLLLGAVFAFETFGIAHTSATNAGVIISLTIVFTPILDSAVSRRRLSAKFLVAAVTAVVGVVLLGADGSLRAPNLGDVLILAAAVARAVHVTSMHRLAAERPMDSLNLTTVQLATCAAMFSVTSVFWGESIPTYVMHVDPSRLALFLYLVIVCTVFAFLVQTWAVRRTSPSRVSLLLGTEPVWAAVIGIALAHDQLALTGYLGIALILGATAAARSIEQRHSLSLAVERSVIVRPDASVTESPGERPEALRARRD